MKKTMLLLCALMITASGFAVSANTTASDLSANTALRYDMQDYRLSSPEGYILDKTIVVNGKVLQAQPMIIHNCTLVPARAVADALGFTTTWDGAAPAVTITSGTMTTTLDLGVDFSTASSIIAIGTTAPISYGAPAVLVGSTAYIPADVFRVIQGNSSDAVVIDDTSISIQSM